MIDTIRSIETSGRSIVATSPKTVRTFRMSVVSGCRACTKIESLATDGIERLGVGRVALNPDCGFAPDAGEPPTIDEAYEKLRRLAEAATTLRKRFGRG